MEEKKYPCRTEVISGVTYIVKMYRDGILRMSASRDSEEDALSYIKRMSEKLPEYTFEISSRPWTSEVCIECGEERY